MPFKRSPNRNSSIYSDRVPEPAINLCFEVIKKIGFVSFPRLIWHRRAIGPIFFLTGGYRIVPVAGCFCNLSLIRDMGKFRF